VLCIESAAHNSDRRDYLMDINTNDQNQGQPKLLRREAQGRIFGGVAAGFAKYFAVDVTLVRVVLVALAFVGGAGVPLYLAGWVLVPEEGSNTAIADGFLHRTGCDQEGSIDKTLYT
jgi:phage shock protein PspC (stress-responsive transcriptional regulator)